MSNPISNYLQRRQAEHDVEMKRLEVEKLSLQRLEEATNLVTERPDTGGWFRSGQLDQSHLPSERATMIRQARNLWRFDPNARAVLATLVYYIVGEGVKVTPQSDDPRLHKLWREFWNAPRNKMALRQAEIVLRALRDGETLIQFFKRARGEDGKDEATWKTTVRFRDPDLLRDPGLEYTGSTIPAKDGIQLDPNDPERAIAFFFQRNYDDATKIDKVKAEDMLHIKIGADSEQRRGESYIQPVMEMFGQYKEWLRYRIVLNKVRTAMVMIRKVTGSAADVEAIKGTLQQSPTARSGEQKKRIPPAGTVLNANGGVDYEFKSANINATDAAEDGRSMKLSMAAGSVVPEYTFGDASNANYASTLIAESPFVKGVRFWQTFFEFYLKEIYRRVLQAAVDAQKLTPPPDDDIFAEEGAAKPVQEAEGTPPVPPKEGEEPEEEPAEGAEKPKKKMGIDPLHEMSESEKFWGCDVQWPEIVHRDMKETATAVIQMRDAGLISDPTAAAVLGYDYEEEVRKQQLVQEEEANNPFKQQASPFGDEGDMDKELQDLVKGLSPDEAQKVMKSNDPAQVAALIREKQKKNKEAV
jgi:hypothetical protein